MSHSSEQYLSQCLPMTEQQYLQTFNPDKEMKLNLKRPLVFIDLETTGTDVKKDKIVEISIVKLHPDMTRESMTKRINPGIAIPLSASSVHGITNDAVKDEPKFTHVSHVIYDFIKDCDVAGYNSNRFDIPLLFREFEYAGIFWDHNSFDMIDICNIYKIKESRSLAAAYKFYCGKELEGAHGAEADINATVEVFLSQLDRYNDLPTSVNELAVFSNNGKAVVDVSGNFYMDNDGFECFNFGKYKDKRVKDVLNGTGNVYKADPGYLTFMLYKSDFPHDTRIVAARLAGEKAPKMLPHQ